MKKVSLLILCILLLPIMVNAKSHYVYDILKEEAESNGLARKYNGEHHDSFAKNPSKNIYHWYVTNDEEVNDVLHNKINVRFANYCWQMIRTTDTGGVKLIFNGLYLDGQCKSRGATVTIGETKFNDNNKAPAYVGYMYNPDLIRVSFKSGKPETNSIIGREVSYSNGVYTISNSNTTTSISSTNHYTCNSTETTCSTVRYYYSSMNYLELTNGQTIEEVINKMLYDDNVNRVDSKVKSLIDAWFVDHLTDYAEKLEDTIFCNDRSIEELGGFNPNGGNISNYLVFNGQTSKSLTCPNDTDKFSVANNKAKLTYPIGLITKQEIELFNNTGIAHIGKEYWLMTPEYFIPPYNSSYGYTYGGSVNGMPVTNTYAVRPVVSLIPGIKFASGTGSENDPYLVKDLSKSDIIVDNDEKKGEVLDLEDIYNIEEFSEVRFTITPVRGYDVEKIIIKDENDNIIQYKKVDKYDYEFTMPNTNVTITPVYKKIENPKTQSIFIGIVFVSIILWLGLLLYSVKKRVN